MNSHITPSQLANPDHITVAKLVNKDSDHLLAKNLASRKNTPFTYKEALSNPILLNQFRAYLTCIKLNLVIAFNFNDINESVEILNGTRKVETKECIACNLTLAFCKFPFVTGNPNKRDKICAVCRAKRITERSIQEALENENNFTKLRSLNYVYPTPQKEVEIEQDDYIPPTPIATKPPRVDLQIYRSADTHAQQLWKQAQAARNAGATLAGVFRELSAHAQSDVQLDYTGTELTVVRRNTVLFRAKPLQLQVHF